MLSQAHCSCKVFVAPGARTLRRFHGFVLHCHGASLVPARDWGHAEWRPCHGDRARLGGAACVVCLRRTGAGLRPRGSCIRLVAQAERQVVRNLVLSRGEPPLSTSSCAQRLAAVISLMQINITRSLAHCSSQPSGRATRLDGRHNSDDRFTSGGANASSRQQSSLTDFSVIDARLLSATNGSQVSQSEPTASLLHQAAESFPSFAARREGVRKLP